jgi:hypothetical protein
MQTTYKTNQSNPTIVAYREAVEKGKKNQHIVPYGKKWAVGNLASGKADQIFSNPEDALKYAEANAAAGTAVFIHGSDGRIKEKKDY